MLKFLLVVIVIAVVTYLAVRATLDRGATGTTPRAPRPRHKPKLVAPDDDEDFLRDLDRKRFHGDDPDQG
ncbi:hypothetical protein [Nocardioides acrostichi]|uniref:Uncharacterized protein n=1 Tax=Nocardioides acrostichi TaxID=2784339 RepID=A0A930V4V2_9ACTN|nr:hypothetical protein [Nocardioides acrostichi]MBF4163877.1 hypothetical protein [Nocardioides acrostichi]